MDRRRFAPALAFASVALLFSGCAPAAVASQTVASTPAPDPTPTALPDGVVGSGTLATPSGEAAGAFDVVKADAMLSLRWQGLAMPERGQVVVAAQRDASDPCIDTGVRYGVGQVDPDLNPTFLGPGDAHETGDPTFLRTVYVGANLGESSPTGLDGRPCLVTIVASGPIAWIEGPNRPWLDGLADDGPRTGARGAAVARADERAGTYGVVEADRAGDIAARFGITVDDLQYLNPNGPEVRTGLQPGQTLNLDLAAR